MEFDRVIYITGLLYYPLDANPPYSSIIIMDAFGDEYGLESWAQFYASHGFIAMTIGNFDRSATDFGSSWDYADRAIGLLDAIETIKEEHTRTSSPLIGIIDTNNFAVSGYSTSMVGCSYCSNYGFNFKNSSLIEPCCCFFRFIKLSC